MRSLHGLLARARNSVLFGCTLLFWAIFAGAVAAQPTVSFKDPGITTNERVGVLKVEVVLSATSTSTVTVQYNTKDGSATSPSDYIAASGTLVFPPGTTSQFIDITIVPDTVAESWEYFEINLSNAQNATVLGGLYAVGIEDGAGTPPPTPTVQFASATYSVVEGTVDPAETDPAKKYTKAVITVSLSAASPSNVSVQYDFAAGGTATANVDYVATPGVVVIPAGQTSATFSIDIVPDNLPEDNETINLVLSSPSGATLGLQTTATLTIMDDDPSSPMVSLSPNPVVLALSGTATLTATVTPASSSASITYSCADPNIATVVGTAPDLTVVGMTAGKTTIVASFGATVLATAPVYVVSASFSPDPSYVGSGTSISLSCTVMPLEGASYLTYGTSDPEIATVSGTAPTLTLSGLSAGVTKVTAFLKIGDDEQSAGSATVMSVTVSFLPGYLEPAIDDVGEVLAEVDPPAAMAALSFDADSTSYFSVIPVAPNRFLIRGLSKGAGSLSARLNGTILRSMSIVVWDPSTDASPYNFRGLDLDDWAWRDVALLPPPSDGEIDWKTLKLVAANWAENPKATKFDYYKAILKDGKTVVELIRGLDSNPEDAKWHCHGYTFPLTHPTDTKGKYSLVGSSVGKYMKANGYEKVGYWEYFGGGKIKVKDVKAGDAMILFRADGTSCVHSCIVKAVEFNKDRLDEEKSYVITKNGIRPVEDNATLGSVIGIYHTTAGGSARIFEFYRKK